MRIDPCAIAALVVMLAMPVAAQRRVPKDLSGVRGFNYQAAESIGHAEHWLHYDPAVTERDLDHARRLELNQVRIFVPFAAWERDKEALRKDLLHFVRAAHERGIGVIPTMQYKFGEWKDRAAWPNSREFVADLVASIGKEPGLEIWDVENEGRAGFRKWMLLDDHEARVGGFHGTAEAVLMVQWDFLRELRPDVTEIQ